ncbi:MAG: bifunctional UDP-N-acetylglucosamine diphosphorylase/glucosamine-1-phosphate N-acetyltransferase GlmU [Actinomycetes bacterium]
MSHPDVAAVVLAAGKGTRFRSDTAKVLHRAAGRSLLGHVLAAVQPLGLGQVVVVVGHQGDEVAAEAARAGIDGLSTVTQHEQLGTGHATEVAMPALADGIRRVLVLPGDTPLLTSDTLAALLDAAAGADAAMLTTVLDDPTGYGRVLRDDAGDVAAIVEHRDATEAQRAVDEVNAGMYAFDREQLATALGRVGDDNAQGERYLTDVVALLRGDGRRVVATVADEAEVAGVNDRVQLADAAAVRRRRHLEELMRAGVTVVDPVSTHVDVDVVVGVDTVLLPNTVLEGGTVVGAGCEVGPSSRLVGCTVADGATVTFSVATDAWIGPGASVGPFAHLRPGTRLADDTKVGAFAETKNATLGRGSKVPHLAYVGDATIGEGVNLSCGVITVNYDGTTKSHTTVEDGAFVGCDTSLVAPVTVGAGAYVAAGSVVTDDVPADALAIARSRQVVKEGWAARRRAQG